MRAKNSIRNILHRVCLTILVFWCLSVFSVGEAAKHKWPNYTGYVNDFAGILSPSVEAKLNRLIKQIEDKTTAQMAVVTLQSTKPQTIEQYAVGLFEHWGIGQKGKDNGVLLLVAVRDRKLRIETGYGLEGTLPDAVCSQIINRIIVPHFRSQDYDRGISAGVKAIAGLIAREYDVQIEGAAKAEEVSRQLQSSRSLLGELFQFVMILLFFSFLVSARLGLFGLLLLGTGHRRGGYWYGSGYGGYSGGFSGGFGGFGGGLSGGGGASGSW